MDIFGSVRFKNTHTSWFFGGSLPPAFLLSKYVPVVKMPLYIDWTINYNLKNKVCKKKKSPFSKDPLNTQRGIFQFAWLVQTSPRIILLKTLCKWHEISTGWFPTLVKKPFSLFAPDAEVFHIRQMFLLNHHDFGIEEHTFPYLSSRYNALRLRLNQLLSWWLQIRALGNLMMVNTYHETLATYTHTYHCHAKFTFM